MLHLPLSPRRLIAQRQKAEMMRQLKELNQPHTHAEVPPPQSESTHEKTVAEKQRGALHIPNVAVARPISSVIPTYSHPTSPIPPDSASVPVPSQEEKLHQQQQLVDSEIPDDEVHLHPVPSDGAPFTPFLFDPSHFEQQDIFDFTTFSRLAAESAAEYARRPLKAFPSLPSHSQSMNCLNSRRAPAAAAASHHVSHTKQHYPRAVSDAFPMRDQPEIPTSPFATDDEFSVNGDDDDDREFERLVREMHVEEVKQLIRTDPVLQAYQRQTNAYKQERVWLQKSMDAKLAALEVEYEQLLRRNQKLQELTEKLQENALKSKGLNSYSSSSVSSAASSPSTPFRRAMSQSNLRSGFSSTASSTQSSCYSTPPHSPISESRSEKSRSQQQL